MGLPEAVARIIDRHVGAGIPGDEAEELGLPEGEYMPETMEEKVVGYADKLVEGRREVDIQVTIDNFAEEHGEDHDGVRRLQALHEKITSLIEDHL